MCAFVMFKLEGYCTKFIWTWMCTMYNINKHYTISLDLIKGNLWYSEIHTWLQICDKETKHVGSVLHITPKSNHINILLFQINEMS